MEKLWLPSTMEILHEDGINKFTLTRKECIPLELKLNVSSKGREWIHIVNILYEFSASQPNALSSITVTDDQYKFLIMLMGKQSWEECRDL